MAFNDIELQRAKNEIGPFVNSIRPPVAMRIELDISFSISGQTIEIEEIRPACRSYPDDKNVLAVVKITFIRKQNAWRLYWMRSSLKWEMVAQVDTLKEAIDIVRDDEIGFFFG